jgi:hypothetical protein
MRAFTMVRLFATTTLTMVGAIAGCGGAGGESNPTNPDSPAGITYTVTPNTLLLAPGQSGTVVVTVTRSPDFSGDVSLGLSGLNSDVTGTFNPASLPQGVTSSTLTIAAGTSGSNIGTVALSLEPSLGGKHVNVNGTPPPFSVTVSIRPTVVVNKAGSGSGTITSTPAGIDCGSVCSAQFLFVPVTLTATPAAGSILTGWTRAECAGAALTCTFTPRVNTMSNFNFVTATFTSTTQGP